MKRHHISCNHAYIDGANLHKGTVALGWRIDYNKFYTWLHEKHRIKRAYIFIGYMPEFDNLYNKMREAGFLIRFKETIRGEQGQVKGNCDADMILRSVRDIYESIFDRAIIVTSDGDFYSLVNALQEKDKMGGIVSPADNCSSLLRKTRAPLTYLRDVRNHVYLAK